MKLVLIQMLVLFIMSNEVSAKDFFDNVQIDNDKCNLVLGGTKNKGLFWKMSG